MIVIPSFSCIAWRLFFKRALVSILLTTTVTSYLLAQGVPTVRPAGRPSVSPRVTHPDAEDPDAPIELKFNSAPLDILLNAYSEKTGKTMLLAPGLPSPNFSLRSQVPLTLDQYLGAIETVLTMHGVGLIHKDDTFIQVVPINELTRDVTEIRETLDETLGSLNNTEMISQMIVLKHIEIPEAIKAIEPLRHNYGKIAAFERTNSILVTETVANIRKILQVLRFIDQEIDAREESFRIQIQHAKATEIKQKLEEIIKDAQEQNKRAVAPTYRSTGAPGATRPSTSRITPGTIRSRVPVPRRPTSSNGPSPATTATAAIERGAIQGNVKIVADERTNLLIFITRAENMPFFEKIIAVLDIETDPDVIVEVVRLEFATAKDVAGMLNDLIGANTADVSTPAGDGAGGKVESTRITDVERRQQSDTRSATSKSSVGELSKDNIKILSDERTNALIIMASRGDLAVLREIVKDMDMMLSQVLIEVAILEIALSDSLQTGVDWIQRSLTTYRGTGAERSPTVSWAGAGGGGRETPIALTLPGAASDLSTAGMRYYMSFFDLNLDVVVSMAASDGRSRVVSTPVLLTTDNTEARLESTDRIYVYDSTTRRSDINGGDFETYKQEDVGLKLEIKPHINENNIVMLEIKQELSQPNPNPPGNVDNLAGQLISRKREIEASVSVSSGDTIVLGGQVREDNNRDRSKVPFLGDIPLLGRLFTYNARTKNRTETVVFMTPYVLDTPEKIQEESRRRRDALDVGGLWERGWSNSNLAEMPSQGSKWWPFGKKSESAGKAGPQRIAPTASAADVRTQSVPAELNSFLQEQEERWREAEQRGGLRP